MYVEEAKEQDSEMVDRKVKNLDQMLLFATLFSAILTAFIIVSKELLEEDPAKLTVDLLRQILESQRQGTQNQSSTPEPFSAPASARWINGLWYAALGLALSSALVAMVAKEWLGFFLTSRPRPPQAYALDHQKRSRDWDRWKVPHIIDLLPAMLNISLLLFSLGLSVYLQTLDAAAANMVIIITTVTGLFFIGTAVLGAVREDCPYHSRFSKYLRVVLGWAFVNRSLPRLEDGAGIKPSKYTDDDDLRALEWLANHARDPAIEDCAYQALAGLRIPDVSKTEPETSTLASGLSSLADVLRSKTPARLALDALDSIWSNDCPELHPDSYAMLVGAQLRVIQAVAFVQHSLHDALATYGIRRVSKSSELNPPHSSIQIVDTPASPIGVDVEHTGGARGEETVSLFELRARYSCALARAAFCLRFHNSGAAQITSYPLAYLLDSVHLAASRANLNSEGCLSTNQPQSEDSDKLPNFQVSVIGIGIYNYLSALRVGDEDALLAGLVGVLSATDIEAMPWVEYVAGRTLWTIGPMLLRQWLQTQDDGLQKYREEQPHVLECVNTALDNWPRLLGEDDLGDLADWTLSQLLAITTITVALAGSACMDQLPQLAASALHRRANMASGRNAIIHVTEKHRLTGNLIHFIRLNHEYLDQTIYDSLLRVLLIKSFTGRSIFRHRAIPANSLISFLVSLCKWPGHVSEARIILSELTELIQEDPDQEFQESSDRDFCGDTYYILPFVSQGEGFASLASLSQIQEYIDIVVECIKNITRCALAIMVPAHPWCKLLPCAVPGLLDCVSIVLKRTANDAKSLPHTLAFLRDVIALLNTIDVEATLTAANHPTIEEMYTVMAQLPEIDEDLADMMAKLEEIRAWAGPDGLMLGGLRRLFEHSEPDQEAVERY
ncbi:hypothetical protein FRC07_005403 [Ceratobasidium sp. 392]|nr:hypothetical protein FRC07_005403 [Ceratobasidium sp. 392]